MKQLIKIFVLAAIGLLPVSASALFKAGTHYVELPFSQSLKTGKVVEVREFFWYGCGHCFQLEPLLTNWKKNKPKAAKLVTTPSFLPKRVEHAKAYYAFETMGKRDKLHGALFNAIHVKRRKLDTADALANFVEERGEDKQAFLKAYGSFDTDRKVKEATQLAQRYGIQSVPTLIIDGRYMTSASMTGSHQNMLKVVDYLVNRIAKSGK